MKQNTRLIRSPLSPQDPNVYRPNQKYKTCVSLHSKNIKNFPSNQMSQVSNDMQKISNSTVLFLDLSNNHLSSDTIQSLGQNLISLNLSNNPLKSCRLPNLSKLRSLNLDNCCISSFQGMPFLPNLKTLSLSGNPILNFSGCPIFPKLESINILKFSAKLIIAAMGSIYLNTINRKKLDQKPLRDAFELSPLVGISLRKGREAIVLDTPEDEKKASLSYLTVDLREYLEQNSIRTEPKLVIKQDGENHVLHCPFDSPTYKWFHHSYPYKGSEWKSIKFNGPDLPITIAIRLHIIKCQITLGGKKFFVYNEDPIGKGSLDYSLPYPVFPLLTGTPIEGSLISILPMPVPCKIIWTKNSEAMDKDKNSIIIPHNAIGATISCILQPYCPQYSEIVFSPIFTSTQVIEPLLPMVTGITFPEIIMESEPIEFDHSFFPDIEGESEIYVERARTPSSEWVVCKQIKLEKMKYKPKLDDIDYFLRISYLPITSDGRKGKITYFYSQSRVIPTTPIFHHPIIGGVGKTNFPLIAIADYEGGRKGKCSYDWYYSKRPIDTKGGPSKRLQKVATNTQYFIPPSNLGEGYVACLMVPVRSDDIVGEPVFVTIDTPLLIEEPPKPLSVPKEAIVGERINFDKPVDFLVSKTDGYYGFDFIKTSKSYKPSEKNVGHILRVITQNSDVVIGEIKPAIPKIISAEITCPNWQVGSTASLSIKHTNCNPDKVEILWLRMNSGFQKAIAIDVPSYDLTPEDAGYSIQVVVTPFDNERNKMEPTFSNVTPIIRQEEKNNLRIVGQLVEGKVITVSASKEIQSVVWYRKSNKKKFDEISRDFEYTLTTSDIGKNIKAVATMANGIVLMTTTNEFVSPGNPTAEVKIPDQAKEGDLITPEIKYNGGFEGKSIKRWYRETENGWEFVSEEPTYQVTADDIDCTLKFIYIPIRQDQKRGQAIELECGPVESLMPSVTNVKLFQNKRGYIEVKGDYKGGVEGQSMIVWRVYDDDGKPQNIGKTISKEMEPTDEFANRMVEAGYVPIREDGIGGQPVMSNTLKVEPLPKVLTAEILVKKGKIVADNPMRCNATVEAGCSALYQWYIGDGVHWKVIDDATNIQFTPSDSEVGYYILCSIVAVNQRGWQSRPYAAATSAPLRPSIISLKIISANPEISSGMVLSTNVGLKEMKKNKIKWQKESRQTKEWKDLSNDAEYIVTANDIGKRIRVIDSIGRISEPTNVIQIDNNIASYVKAMVKNCNLKFVGNPKLGPVVWYGAASSYGVSLETADKKKKQSKWSLIKVKAVPGTVDEMVIWMDPSSKFHLIPSLSHDPRLESLVKRENVRDFVVCAIKGIRELYVK